MAKASRTISRPAPAAPKRRRAAAPASPKAAKQLKFLEAFSRCCRIDQAAKAAHIDRRTHYDWLRDDPEYPAKFEEATKRAVGVLRDVAVKFATEGTLMPVFQGGELVGHKRLFATGLLAKLLGALDPAFRAAEAPTGSGEMTPEQLLESARRLIPGGTLSRDGEAGG